MKLGMNIVMHYQMRDFLVLVLESMHDSTTGVVENLDNEMKKKLREL
jgi:hypothetical protein